MQVAALPQPNTNPTVAIPTKDGKRLDIRGKCKQALDLMIWQGYAWNEAAQKVGYTVRSMRMALERPHVRQYIQHQKQVFREAASARNIQRLVEIRDQDDNKTAAVQAIKVLEQQPDDERSAAAARTPGVVIVINSPSDAAKVVDVHTQTTDDV